MRQRDARVGRSGDGAGDAGDFLERHARVQQFLGLFAAASENVGVPALEAGHDFAFLGLFHDQPVDAVLRQGVVSGDLADVDALRVGAGVAEQRIVGEVVVDDHVGLFENFLSFNGQQAGVAGSGADEIDFHAILVSCPEPELDRLAFGENRSPRNGKRPRREAPPKAARPAGAAPESGQPTRYSQSALMKRVFRPQCPE